MVNSDGKTAVSTPDPNVEPVYPVAQLIEHYKSFGTSRALVFCALMQNPRKNLSFAQAREIINQFKNREVT